MIGLKAIVLNFNEFGIEIFYTFKLFTFLIFVVLIVK